MADQCIVCLEDLDVVPDPSVHDDLREVAAASAELSTPHPSKTDNQQPIALIKPCGHVLHDECLREWSQKANSCPICRHAFNLVEVLDKVGGMFFPSFQNPFLCFRTLCQNTSGSARVVSGLNLCLVTRFLHMSELRRP
jgi:hypothetical protein